MARAGKTLGWVAISVLTLALSAWWHFGTPLARRVARDFLTDLASTEMKGELAIGTLEELSLSRIDARDITLRDPEGRVVVVADRLVLVPDRAALWRLEPRFVSARLEGATATLVDDGEGLPTLIGSFDSAVPTPPREAKEPATPIVVEGIHVTNLTLRGELLGLAGIEALDVEAEGMLEIGDDVHVRIDRATGRLVQPFPYEARVEQLAGTISTVTTEGIALQATVRRGEERASAHIGYASPENAPEADGHLSLAIKGTNVSPGTIKGLGFDFIDPIAVAVTGTLNIGGPVDSLSLDAEVQSDAGAARIVGTITDEDGTRVRIESERVDLGKAFREGPPIDAAGTVELHASGSEPLGIKAQVEPLLYGEIAVPSFELEGQFEDGRFTIDRVASRQGKLEASGTLQPDGSMELRVTAHIPDIGRDPNLKRYVKNARGGLQADLRVVTPPEGKRLRFQGRLVLTNLRYGMVSARRLVITGSAQGDPQAPTLNLKLSGTAVSVGVYPLGDARFAVKGGPSLYKASGQFLRAGRRTFDLNASVQSDRKGMRIDADTLELSVGEETWRGTLQGLTITNDDVVALELLRLANRSQRLEAKGIVRDKGEDSVEAQLQDFDLAAVHALVGDAFVLREGRTDTHLTLTGDLARPQILIQGALREGKLLDIADVNALYFASYDTGQVELDMEVDLGDRGLLRATGSGFVDPSMTDPRTAAMLGSYRMELATEQLDLSLWPGLAATGWGGKLGGSMRLHGTLASPELNGNVELTPLTHPDWDPLLVAGKVQYAGRRMGMGLSVADERGTLVLADAQMELDWGTFTRDPQAALEAALRSGWSITGQTLPRRLDAYPRPASASLPLPLLLESNFRLWRHAGKTSGEVTYDGRWDQTLGSQICAEGIKAGVRGEATLADGKTVATGALLANDAALASLELRLDTPIDAWLESGYTPPARMGASGRINVKQLGDVPWLCEYGDGDLTGELELDYAKGAPPLVAVTLASNVVPRRPQVGIQRDSHDQSCKGIPLRVNLEVNADARRMRADGTLDGCGGGPAKLSSRIPMHWDPDQLTLLPTNERISQIYLTLDASQIGPFLHQIPGVLSGEAIARGKLGLVGPIDDLRSEGRVEIDGGRLYLVATGQQLTDLSAQIDMRGDWAKLEHATASDGDGRLELTGGIGFDNVTPARMRLATRLDDFPARSEGMALAWLTGSAAIETDLAKERTHTAVQVHDLAIRLPDTVNRTLQPLEAHPEVTISTEEEPLVEPGHPLEFFIEGTRGIRVRRNDVEAELTVELAVVYEDPELRVGGYVEFRRGTFEVQGKRFRINQGSLRFDGGPDLNPDVHLVATHDVPGGSPVTVSIGGSFAEPEIAFTTEACPGEGEALAYLLWGRCLSDDPGAAGESAQAENALGADILAAVVGAGIGVLGLQREYGGITPRLGIEQGSGNQSRVKAGVLTDALIPKFMRPLVQRVYVQGAYTTGNAGDFDQPDAEATQASLDFLLELYFPNNIIGSGRFTESSSWGVDVIWEP